MPRRRRKKQNSKRTSNGFRSGFEATVASQLRRCDVDYNYETLQIEYRKIATYLPDFILLNGVILEAKGVWTVEDRTKHLLIREQHPELDVRLVFQNANNKIRKGSKTTYAAWCDKKGIKWCNKVIPKSWFQQRYTNHAMIAGVVTLSPET
jgi:hypothetical protein